MRGESFEDISFEIGRKSMWDLEHSKENLAIYLKSKETISYRQSAQRLKRIGSALEGRPIVVMVCENTLGCIMCYLSFVQKGILPILLPSDLKEQDTLRIAQIFRAKYLSCAQDYLTQNWKPLFVVQDYVVYEIPKWEETEIRK